MRRPPGLQMLARARGLRRAETQAEHVLWQRLRARQLDGFKFRRQMWLCGYIADFVYIEAELVIEADGGQHDATRDYDRERSAQFAAEGFRTLRFWNNDTLENVDGVLATIRDSLPSPARGEGGAPRSGGVRD